MELTLSECTQIISAVGTFGAAVFAAITTWQNHRQIVESENERHQMIKPIFNVSSISEERLNKKYSFEMLNIGFDKLKSVNCIWDGVNGVVLDYKQNKFISLNITLDFSNVDKVKDGKQGEIKLVYFDILGKKYITTLPISLKILKTNDVFGK